MRNIKQIPKKNYIIYSIILCLTLGVSLIAFFIYNNQKSYDDSIPILRAKVKEIESKDVDQYLLENPNSLLYIGVAQDSNSRHIEKELINLINNNNLNVIYLNITDLSNKKEFYKSFNSKYGTNHTLQNYPAFIIIRESKIFDMVQRTDRDLYIGDIQKLIDIYELKGDNDD
jgi:hypothetical protein